ncbi:MAG TPA: signal recognition particle-docking protein FtsY [Blastocatellia bacterium]|nr:signal recognition particle-docking protein FtsY [Blastocatellia bacterium]
MGLFWKRKKDDGERPAHWPPTILAPPGPRRESPDAPPAAPVVVEAVEAAAPAPQPTVDQAPRPVPMNFSFGGYIKAEPTPEEIAEAERTFYGRLKTAVSSTRHTLVDRIDTIVRGKKVIDAELLESLEEALIGADIGVQTALGIIETARKQVARNELSNPEELRRLIREQLLALLEAPTALKKGTVASETEIDPDIKPYVIMIVGVNGVGKTTTIGKLAHRIKNDGYEVLICAADTFRAAANDQLAIWAERTGVPLIQQKPGTDPSAVLYDSLAAAKARGADVLIVDTAGRLHTKQNLMQELEKMQRVAGRQVPNAPHEILLVIDAVTGQNGLEQARQFTKSAPVTGLVLTKLDGTAKGGIVVAIVNELGVPIRYVGIGEQLDDLVAFDAHQYIDSLFEY